MTSCVITARNALIGGILLRIGMLVYGLWQDANMTVKYTDIDYNVFTDAARFVWEGQSPYNRSTYRYTPILAWILTPNIWLHHTYGKLVFVLCDCIVGDLIIRILKRKGFDDRDSAMYSALWLLNPQVATISTRGSAESVICTSVMASFYALQCKKVAFSAVLFGLAVHLKIYPIIYALPILLVLESSEFEKTTKENKKGSVKANTNSSTSGQESQISSILGFVNIHRVKFALISASTFFVLNLIMYAIYGMEFLDETYLYHVTRKDHRHNYSLWFLPIYLTFKSQASVLMGLVSFLPQALVVAVLGTTFSSDLYFSAFAQTFAFVAYNKVCTAQYFMWYICFLPVIWPFNSQKLIPKGLLLLAAWFGSQAFYLQQAYNYEFLGQNTFVLLWVSGLIIFVANNWVLQQVISSQQIVPLFKTVNGIQHKEKNE